MIERVTYADLQASIAEEKQRRIREHKSNVAKRRRMAPLALEGNRPLSLLAQGDSWFDYPLPPGEQTDVLAHLRQMPSMAPEILSLAHHGEAAENMMGVRKLREFVQQLGDPENGGFDAILFSGGGNDVAGDQFRLWLRDASAEAVPGEALDPQRLDAIFSVVRAGYEDLLAARNRIDYFIPVFAHSYDFAIPSGRGACGAGPWLKPGLDDRGWADGAVARSIVRDILIRFAEMLDGFAAVAANNFVHVHTQGTLSEGQWANELHPDPAGFAAISAKFVEALRDRFPGRI